MNCELCLNSFLEKDKNDLICEDCKEIYISLDELEEKYQGEEDV